MPLSLAKKEGFLTKTTKIQGKKKHININKFAELFRDWVGAEKLFMCFVRAIPYGGEKTHIIRNPPPKKSRDNPAKTLFMCFLLYVFFRSLKMTNLHTSQ